MSIGESFIMNSVVGSGLPSPLAGLEECLSMENYMKPCNSQHGFFYATGNSPRLVKVCLFKSGLII